MVINWIGRLCRKCHKPLKMNQWVHIWGSCAGDPDDLNYEHNPCPKRRA